MIASPVCGFVELNPLTMHGLLHGGWIPLSLSEPFHWSSAMSLAAAAVVVSLGVRRASCAGGGSGWGVAALLWPARSRCCVAEARSILPQWPCSPSTRSPACSERGPRETRAPSTCSCRWSMASCIEPPPVHDVNVPVWRRSLGAPPLDGG